MTSSWSDTDLISPDSSLERRVDIHSANSKRFTFVRCARIPTNGRSDALARKPPQLIICKADRSMLYRIFLKTRKNLISFKSSLKKTSLLLKKKLDGSNLIYLKSKQMIAQKKTLLVLWLNLRLVNSMKKEFPSDYQKRNSRRLTSTKKSTMSLIKFVLSNMMSSRKKSRLIWENNFLEWKK